MYVRTDALLLADVFENFQKLYLKICKLNLAKFLSAPGLAWQADLRKTKVKLNLLTDVDVIKGRKRYKGKKVSFIYQYEKANNKYMKDYGKNKESPHIQYWDVNN